MSNITITGAAGRIAAALCSGLARTDRTIRGVDLPGQFGAGLNFETKEGDLTDYMFAQEAMADTDVLIHLAAIHEERDWDEIFPTNFIITRNAFDAARRAGVKKIIYASSIQAVGFHPIANKLDATARIRPSGNYGVSKAFGEAYGSLLADKTPLSFVAVRVASYEPAPGDPRMLKTWLSPEDTLSLFDACIDSDAPHYDVVYGVSANSGSMVSNDHATWLNWEPKSNADDYRQHVETAEHALTEIGALTHGGDFCGMDNTDPEHSFLKY